MDNAKLEDLTQQLCEEEARLNEMADDLRTQLKAVEDDLKRIKGARQALGEELAGKGIVLMFDGDEAGRQATRTAAGKLLTKCLVGAVKLEDGLQPDDDLEDYVEQIKRF